MMTIKQINALQEKLDECREAIALLPNSNISVQYGDEYVITIEEARDTEQVQIYLTVKEARALHSRLSKLLGDK